MEFSASFNNISVVPKRWFACSSMTRVSPDVGKALDVLPKDTPTKNWVLPLPLRVEPYPPPL